MTMGSDGFFQYKGKDFALTLDVVNGWNDWDAGYGLYPERPDGCWYQGND